MLFNHKKHLFNTYISFGDTRNTLLDEFEDTDENKLSYTGIFQDYCSTIEAHLEKAVKQEIPVPKNTHKQCSQLLFHTTLVYFLLHSS